MARPSADAADSDVAMTSPKEQATRKWIGGGVLAGVAALAATAGPDALAPLWWNLLVAAAVGLLATGTSGT
jgi:hypothetical protein